MITPETIDRLKAQLLTSGISQQNQALYQVINLLIDAVRQSLTNFAVISGGGGGGGIVSGQTFLTTGLEQGSLPNSRQLLPGSGITVMDDGIHKLIGASMIPHPCEYEDSEAYIPLPGPQGPIGPTGPAGSSMIALGMPLPIEYEPEEIVPVPLENKTGLDQGIVFESDLWTPVLSFGGASVGITYSTQVGFWVKIGPFFYASFRFTLTSKGASVGVASIAGLPSRFATTKTPPGDLDSISMSGLTGSTLIVVPSGTSNIVPVQNNATGRVQLTDTEFTNTSDLRGGIIWILD